MALKVGKDARSLK